MCARPPVRAQVPDHRPGQRSRRSREGPGVGVKRAHSRKLFSCLGTDSTPPPAGRGRVGARFGAGPVARLSPATEAAPSPSRKRRAAQVFCAARRALRLRGVFPKHSRPLRFAHQTNPPPAKREPPGPRKYPVRAGRRPSGRIFHHSAPATISSRIDNRAPVFFLPCAGPISSLLRRMPSDFSGGHHPIRGRRRGPLLFHPGGRQAESFLGAAPSIPSAGRRFSAGGPSRRDRLLSLRAGRLPVFPGGVIRTSGTTPRLRGFPIATRPAFFPSWREASILHPGGTGFLPPRGTIRHFWAGGPFFFGRPTRPGSSSPD